MTTVVHPAAIAGPILRDSMEDGKFHGVIAATTPTGSRVTRPSWSWGVAATSS